MYKSESHRLVKNNDSDEIIDLYLKHKNNENFINEFILLLPEILGQHKTKYGYNHIHNFDLAEKLALLFLESKDTEMLQELVKIDPFDFVSVSILLANPETGATPEMIDFFFSIVPKDFYWKQFRKEFGSHLGPFDEKQFEFYKLFLIPAIKYNRWDFLEEEIFDYFKDERDQVEDVNLQNDMDAIIMLGNRIIEKHRLEEEEEEYSNEEY